MEPLSCDVCGKEALGVASSSLGAISFAYCQSCLAAHAEPYGMLVGVVAMSGGRNEMAPWVADVVSGTLSVVGKNIEEFDADVASETERFIREMSEEGEVSDENA